MKPKEI